MIPTWPPYIGYLRPPRPNLGGPPRLLPRKNRPPQPEKPITPKDARHPCEDKIVWKWHPENVPRRVIHHTIYVLFPRHRCLKYLMLFLSLPIPLCLYLSLPLSPSLPVSLSLYVSLYLSVSTSLSLYLSISTYLYLSIPAYISLYFPISNNYISV